MKTAIIHYWLIGMRGGEKTLEALCDLFPQADIFTHVLIPEAISPRIKQHVIETSFISRLPMAATRYKAYLPLMPMALEQFDLRDYELIVSQESGPAKGVIPAPGAVHACYCHSPMRYIWNMYHDYRNTAGPLTRWAMPMLAHYLRNWDQSAAARVDGFIANSYNVQKRIRKYYRRDSQIVHPPVDVNAFAESDEIDDYYLMVGELVGYKRPDLAVDAFNRNGKRLVVIGRGPMLAELKKMARPNVEILGAQPTDVLKRYYSRCKALIFPGEEDFGIVPLEAMASGRPVIAYGRGGALETVVDGRTGLLFEEQSVDCLDDALTRLDRLSLAPADLMAHARSYDLQRFKVEMRAAIDNVIRDTNGTPNRPVESTPFSQRGMAPRAFAFR